MSRGHFTRVTPVAGISIFCLGIGLAVTACSPTTSSAAAPAGVTKTATSTTASNAPSATASASASSAPAVSSATTATPSATATPVPVSAPYVMWDCENTPQVRPTSYMLACADGNDRLTDMHWTNWTPAGASGTGVQYLNDCTPNCAVGHFHSFPVDISLTGSYKAGPNKPLAYTKVTLTYTAARPVVYVRVHGEVEATHPATWTLELPTFHSVGGNG